MPPLLRRPRRFGAPASAAAALVIASSPPPAVAQTRTFLYTVVTPTSATPTPRSLVYTDLAYGERMFAAVGPEHLEPRVAAQLGLSRRVTLLVQAGWAPADDAVRNRLSGQAEALLSILPAGSRATLALGTGAMCDYGGTFVALGRVVAAYRWNRSELAANLRFEHAFAAAADAGEFARRDPLDVITTAGLMQDVGAGLSIGVETIGEDLEGFWEADEAEGGAKLMIGPTLSVRPPGLPWQLLLGVGAIFHLTYSTQPGTASGAARDLTTGQGYVVRASVTYQLGAAGRDRDGLAAP